MATNLKVSKMQGGLINIQSVSNKTFDIHELIKDANLDILAVTETWLSTGDSAKICEMTPVTHNFLHTPRETRGGGVGIFISNSIKKIAKQKCVDWNTFELLQVNCEIEGRKCILIVVYRPPSTVTREFIDEFRLFLESVDMVSTNVLICGDFNLWIDDSDNASVIAFVEMMDSYNLVNKVHEATSIGGHILDLVFCDIDRDPVQDLNVDEVCTISPVHKLVTFKLAYVKECSQKKKISFRLRKNFHPELLVDSISNEISLKRLDNCEHALLNEKCVTCFIKLYNNVATMKYNESCPQVEKEVIVRDSAPWFNGEVARAKQIKKIEGEAVASA